ncbi:MAG TPA: DUF29 domain-containing protein [Gemmataceae bacterium]|nr:DUF29 domain-containing protein [Gemmataceae bacterium]
MTQTETTLADLYEADETAWLDAMAELIRCGDHSSLDYTHLQEYLADMAIRDRREVKSRLIALIAHILKWIHQPDHRTGSWRVTIDEQRNELVDIASQGVLRNHAEAILAEAYERGVNWAKHETGLPAETFPAECPYTLDQLLSVDLTANET